MKTQSESTGQVIIYKNQIEVTLDKDTVWLNLNQISSLFDRDKSVISRHLIKIFQTKELNRNSVVAFFATTASQRRKI